MWDSDNPSINLDEAKCGNCGIHLTRPKYHIRHGQMFYISEIPKFYLRKRVNRDIFGQELRMKKVLLIYFEQIVSFCAIIYSNTNSLQLFCETVA